ncbi:MAG: response regulator [Pirellulales bacterium]
MTDAARILVIDDETPLRKFLRISLETAGYAPTEAETAEQGIRTAAATPPEAVILDLGLPDADGLDVIRRLREWTTVPIIVLSCAGVRRTRSRRLTAGPTTI